MKIKLAKLLLAWISLSPLISSAQKGKDSTYTTVTVINTSISSVSNTIAVFGVLIIPNVITLNQDDVNEKFVIQGLKLNSGLVIINRWGEVVLDTDNYLNDWEGKDKSGKELTDGVYTYLLKEPDGNLKHGIIHLIR